MKSMLFLFTFAVLYLGPVQGLLSTKTLKSTTKSTKSTVETPSPEIDANYDDGLFPKDCTDLKPKSSKSGAKSAVPHEMPSMKTLFDSFVSLIFGEGLTEKDLPEGWVQYWDCYTTYYEKTYGTKGGKTPMGSSAPQQVPVSWSVLGAK